MAGRQVAGRQYLGRTTEIIPRRKERALLLLAEERTGSEALLGLIAWTTESLAQSSFHRRVGNL